MRFLLLILLMVSTADAQVPQPWQGGTGCESPTTVSSLPASPNQSTICMVTDGNSTTDCTTGGGSTAVWCYYEGSTWQTLSSVDTNANTICTGTKVYLDGEGNCDTLDEVSDFSPSLFSENRMYISNSSNKMVATFIPSCENSINGAILEYDSVLRKFVCDNDGIRFPVVASPGGLALGECEFSSSDDALFCATTGSGSSGAEICDDTGNCSGVYGGGGGGTNIVLDLGDDGVNESSAIDEIATTNDTNNIFTEPVNNKLLIDVIQNWPTCDEADDLSSACVDCINATEIEDIYVLNSGDSMTGNLTVDGNVTIDAGHALLLEGTTQDSNFQFIAAGDPSVNRVATFPDTRSGTVCLTSDTDGYADDLVCTDCINATEIEDIYLLNAGDIATGQVVIDGSADEVQFIVEGHSTQTNSLVRFRDSTLNTVYIVEPSGEVYNAGRTKIDGSLPGLVTLVVEGAPSQTANIAAIQSSGGADTFFRVTAAGRVDVNDSRLQVTETGQVPAVIEDLDAANGSALLLSCVGNQADGAFCQQLFYIDDDAGGSSEFAKIRWQANDTDSTSEDGAIWLMVSSNSTVPVSSYRIIGGHSDATTHQKIAWVNPDKEDVDFRYDGDTNNFVFFCDGSTEVCDFSSAPTVGGTAVDVDGHSHVEADVTDLLHTPDTTCLDAGVACNFAGSASEGGSATSALDLTCTDCVQLTSETAGDYVATIDPGVGSKVTVSGSGTEGRAVTLGLSTLTLGTDTTAELDPAACSNANCTVDLAGDTVTGGTVSRCARFDGFGNLVAASGDCSAGDTDTTLSGSAAGGDLTGTYPNPTIAGNAVALGTDTTGNYVATVAPGAGSKVTVTGSGSESAAVTLGLSTLTIGTDTTAELDPDACSNTNCTVDITGDTVTGGTVSRCARFDGSGNLVAAGGDCSSGDTTIANTTCDTDTCTLNDDTIVLLDANGAAPTTDGEIKYDRTTERIEVGDGSGTVEFYSGDHTTDTNAGTICSGTTTYLDGEGACDDISGVYVDVAGDTMTGTLNGTTFAASADVTVGGISVDVDGHTHVEADVTDLDHTATAITDGLIVEADLNEDSGTPIDEDVLTYDSTGGNFLWVAQNTLDAGTANLATTATNVTVATSTDTTASIAFFESATGNLGAKTDAELTYNATTNVLTATEFAGSFTGTADYADNLSLNPADCGANEFANTIGQNGDLSCVALVDADVPNDITINQATLASTVTVADIGGDTTSFVALTTDATGSLSVDTDAGITYNSTSNVLTATGFAGNLTGTADFADSLSNNGANCNAGEIPLGVDKVGAVEGCYEPAFTDVTGSVDDTQLTETYCQQDKTNCATWTLGTDTTAEQDPAACTNANCTVDLAGDTVTGGTASRCARFDGSGNLVSAGGDCSSGDTDTTCLTTGIDCQFAGASTDGGAANSALDVTCSAPGCVTLETETVGDYVESVADAGNATITVSGSGEAANVTLDAVDLNCTDCLTKTEIEDIYLFNKATESATSVHSVGTHNFSAFEHWTNDEAVGSYAGSGDTVGILFEWEKAGQNWGTGRNIWNSAFTMTPLVGSGNIGQFVNLGVVTENATSGFDSDSTIGIYNALEHTSGSDCNTLPTAGTGVEGCMKTAGFDLTISTDSTAPLGVTEFAMHGSRSVLRWRGTTDISGTTGAARQDRTSAHSVVFDWPTSSNPTRTLSKAAALTVGASNITWRGFPGSGSNSNTTIEDFAEIYVTGLFGGATTGPVYDKYSQLFLASPQYTINPSSAQPYAIRQEDSNDRMVNTLQSDTTVGGTATPIATMDIRGFIYLEPQASPPVVAASCSLGMIYTDTSGALCYCTGGSWFRLNNGGTCA